MTDTEETRSGNDSFSGEKVSSGRFNRFRRLYISVAIVTLNTLVAFALINLVLGIAFTLRDSQREQRDQEKRIAEGEKLYRDVPDAPYGVETVLEFSARRGNSIVWQPWTHFGQRPVAGKHLNVELDALGFPRRRGSNPEVDDEDCITIFALGASTTFGWMVPDDQTWPSHLSRILNQRLNDAGAKHRVKVINYGCPAYYPTQETALFQDLLRLGHRPDLVIFMDGVNIGLLEDTPAYTSKFRERIDVDPSDRFFGSRANVIPAIRLGSALAARREGENKARRDFGKFTIDLLVNRFEAHRHVSQMVAQSHGVETLFVLQPHGLLHSSAEKLEPNEIRMKELIQGLRQRLQKMPDWIDLGPTVESYGPRRKWLLTAVHYTPDFSRHLAEAIAGHIDLGAFDPAKPAVDPSAATSPPRVSQSSR